MNKEYCPHKSAPIWRPGLKSLVEDFSGLASAFYEMGVKDNLIHKVIVRDLEN